MTTGSVNSFSKTTAILLLVLFLASAQAAAQKNVYFNNLPLGNYTIGFRIVTIVDKSRVTKPYYNYTGAIDTTDRYRKISIHMWYPSKPRTGGGRLTYGEYCYNSRLESTAAVIKSEEKDGMLASQRETFQGFFGKVNDNDWEKIVNSTLLSVKDASPIMEKFPLLVGMLRPLSTSVTNELLASNGYVVAMVPGGKIAPASREYQAGCIEEVRDMQQVIEYLSKLGTIDESAVGTFGFSGSGFTQVLFAMDDQRVRALADLESGIYLDGLWEPLAANNYYNDRNLRIPFLHIYGREGSKREMHIDKFEKLIFSERYRLLLNYAGLHHWDLATEGRASTTVLHIRGDKEKVARASFELANIYLLHFFNSVLKGDDASKKLLEAGAAHPTYSDSLLTLTHYPALEPPLDASQFEEFIHSKGIDSAVALVRKVILTDSVAEIASAETLNMVGNGLRRKEKLNDALKIMELATELHPGQAWLWNNLAGMHENFGDKQQAIRCSEKVVSLFKAVKLVDGSFNERMLRVAEGRIKRLKAGE